MSILRALLVVIVVVAVTVMLLGFFGGPRTREALSARADIKQASDTVERARARGAEIGEKAAIAATKVEETIDEAMLTAKIKAKMALDDSVKARAINVTTHGTTVTLSGTVESRVERDRAVALTSETDASPKSSTISTYGEDEKSGPTYCEWRLSCSDVGSE